MKHGFMDNPIVYEIKCRFDGTKLGELKLPRELWEGKPLTNEILGVGDSRCDACIVEHGKYKDLDKEAKEKGLSHEEFKDVMSKCNFSKKTFKVELDKAIKKKMV
jgi:hypothetical protein